MKGSFYCVTMLFSFSAVISLTIVYVISTTSPQVRAQPGVQSAAGPEDSGSSSIAYVTVNEMVIEMNVPSSGQLTPFDLEYPIKVKRASIRSEREITCFFWTKWEDRTSSTNGRGVILPISMPFSTDKDLLRAYSSANVLYCFDSTEEKASDDTFSIFVENASGMKDLVRMKARQPLAQDAERVSDEAATEGKQMKDLYAVLDLRESYPELRKSVLSIALVRAPTAPRQFFWNNAFPRNMCTALWTPNRGARFYFSRQLYLNTPRDLLRFSCYRAIDSQSARRNWQSTQWMTELFGLD